ncbi:hypothetical protein SDC9_148435 [bioreactor metagenome]|uniref:Uncharacterized protein n=1 Tax=bioreactor metagenome TaxID=1076179 RepID=A0A645EJB1_9ZZZZ
MVATNPATVQVVPVVEYAPPTAFVFEKFMLSRANFSSSGITEYSHPPPLFLLIIVVSIDSRYITIRFLLFSGNFSLTSCGLTYSSPIKVEYSFSFSKYALTPKVLYENIIVIIRIDIV